MDSTWLEALWELAPTVIIGVIFWLVMRALLRADRTERKAYAKIEAQERARIAAEQASESRASAP